MTQKQQADLVFENGRFSLTGDLVMANVMSVREKSLRQFASQKELIVDFSKLRSCDSSALALILDWIAFAEKNNCRISFKQLPGEIFSIATAAGLNELLLPLTI